MIPSHAKRKLCDREKGLYVPLSWLDLLSKCWSALTRPRSAVQSWTQHLSEASHFSKNRHVDKDGDRQTDWFNRPAPCTTHKWDLHAHSFHMKPTSFAGHVFLYLCFQGRTGNSFLTVLKTAVHMCTLCQHFYPLGSPVGAGRICAFMGIWGYNGPWKSIARGYNILYLVFKAFLYISREDLV